MVRPKLVRTVTGPDGRKWRIYHVSRRDRPDLFRMPGKRDVIGLTHFRGKHAGKIFIATDRQTPAQIFDTTLHELAHVAFRSLVCDDELEEFFVEGFAARLAPMLEQLGC